MSPEKCKHPACTCAVPEGKQFCSHACEEAQSTGSACACGHPDCAGVQHVAAKHG